MKTSTRTVTSPPLLKYERKAIMRAEGSRHSPICQFRIPIVDGRECEYRIGDILQFKRAMDQPWEPRHEWELPRWVDFTKIRRVITSVFSEPIQSTTWKDAAECGVEAWDWPYRECPACSENWGCLRPPQQDGGCGVFKIGYVESFKFFWEKKYPGSWERNDSIWVVKFGEVPK